MSGAPEDDGDDSQDGGGPEETAARQDRERNSVSPERGEQHMMTGAQRRRQRRLLEDQQLAEEDPEAWAHLQQTRAAMMPYGWDKCEPRHTVCAACLEILCWLFAFTLVCCACLFCCVV